MKQLIKEYVKQLIKEYVKQLPRKYVEQIDANGSEISNFSDSFKFQRLLDDVNKFSDWEKVHFLEKTDSDSVNKFSHFSKMPLIFRLPILSDGK